MSPSWFEHVDLMQLAIIGLLIVLGWFFKRTLSKIDKNQTLLFAKYDGMNTRVSTLEGEHVAFHYGKRAGDIH